MSNEFTNAVTTREAAHHAVSVAYVHAKVLLEDGKRVRISCEVDDDPVTVRQHRFFHGPLLRQISEQVRVEGQRYARELWKEHLKNVLLPDEWVMRKLPFVIDKATGKPKPSKKAVPFRLPKSLAGLSVKDMSDFIDRSIAHAATEWGVEFRFNLDEREAVRYVAPVRRVKQAAGEAATA